MSFAPAVSPIGGQLLAQGIGEAGKSIGSGLMQALQKYEEDKKQREFNTGLLDTLKRDPAAAKYVPADALEKWDSMNGDKQAGVLAGIARRTKAEQEQAQTDYYKAHAE